MASMCQEVENYISTERKIFWLELCLGLDPDTPKWWFEPSTDFWRLRIQLNCCNDWKVKATLSDRICCNCLLNRLSKYPTKRMPWGCNRARTFVNTRCTEVRQGRATNRKCRKSIAKCKKNLCAWKNGDNQVCDLGVHRGQEVLLVKGEDDQLHSVLWRAKMGNIGLGNCEQVAVTLIKNRKWGYDSSEDPRGWKIC